MYPKKTTVKHTSTKISKWGNGFGIRIPASMLSAHNIDAGSIVHISSKDNNIIVTPLEKDIGTMSMVELFGDTNPEILNEHDSYFGTPQGNEVW